MRTEHPAGRPSFGISGYISSVALVLAALFLRSARATSFVHGTELAWLMAYSVPLVLAVSSFALAALHLFRGRRRMVTAWLPLIGSMILGAWLVAYVFGGAFREG